MTNTRVNEIDLFRIIAALSVVFFHYSFRGYAADSMSVMPYLLLAPVSKYGYLGVQLFFMISGFVILMTAANGTLRDFVISRIVRLYPAFWVSCTITFAVIVALGAPYYSASIGQYLVNMTMLSEFLRTPPIDGAYWSLFVEIRFYVLVAIVLAVGKIRQAELFIFLWLVAAVFIEFVPTIFLLQFLLIADYSVFFIAGATCFLIWSKGLTRTRAAMVAVSWALAVFQSIKALRLFEDHYHTTMSGYVVAVIITAFFAVMVLISLRRTGSLGNIRWQFVGAISYPLYLLHENVGFIVFNAAYPKVNAHLLLWGTTIGVIALACAVHVFIEKPFSSSFKAILIALADRVQRRSSSGRAELRR